MVHDTTGGMATKIEEAVEAAVLGIPVLIVKVSFKVCFSSAAGYFIAFLILRLGQRRQRWLWRDAIHG